MPKQVPQNEPRHLDANSLFDVVHAPVGVERGAFLPDTPAWDRLQASAGVQAAVTAGYDRFVGTDGRYVYFQRRGQSRVARVLAPVLD